MLMCLCVCLIYSSMIQKYKMLEKDIYKKMFKSEENGKESSDVLELKMDKHSSAFNSKEIIMDKLT